MDFNIVQSYILKLPDIKDLKRLEKITEIIEQYSEEVVEEYLRKIIDRRHKLIVAAKEDGELSEIDFSYDYYINTLRKELVVEKGRPIKKVINCTGIIYSKHIGERFYSDEMMRSFNDIFKNYNNLEFDEEKSDRISVEKEFAKLAGQMAGEKKVLAVNNIMGGIYLVVDTLFRDKEVLMSLSDTFYLSGGMGIHDIVSKAGGKEKLIGYINKIDKTDYIKNIKDGSEVVIYSDMFENTGLGIKKVEISDIESINEAASAIYISDRVYFNTDSEEIKNTGNNFYDIINKNIDIVLIDMSKFIGGPESALIIASEEIVEKLKLNFISKILQPGKETTVLMYLVLKAYLDKRYNDIYINKCFLMTDEKLKEKNRRFMRNIEREMGDRVEMRAHPSKLFRISENVSDKYCFDRDVIHIKPLNKNAADIERELRMGEPNILCWLDVDTLIFNLQLVREEDENIIIDALSKKI